MVRAKIVTALAVLESLHKLSDPIATNEEMRGIEIAW